MQGNYWDIRPLPQRTRTRIPKLTQIPKRRYIRRIQIPPPVYEYVDPFQSDYEIPDFTPEQKKKKRGYGTGYGFGDYIVDSSSSSEPEETPFQAASSSSSSSDENLDPRDSIYWEEAQEKLGDLGPDDNILDLYPDIQDRIWKRQK